MKAKSLDFIPELPAALQGSSRHRRLRLVESTGNGQRGRLIVRFVKAFAHKIFS